MFAGDEQTVWILGDDLIQFSNDGGENWEQLEYQVRAAPWVWSTFVLALLLLGFSFRPLTVSVSSVADEFASDRPVDDGDPDLLHRGRTARALSRFLRNESTEAPLTVAITGDWGQGKSSLMNLAAADLKRHRSRVILFNAWHHQRERHLFAALLQAVRKQAIPKLWEPYGVWFRIRLVLSRWRRLAFSLILLALAFFARLAVDERLGEDVAAFINERLGGAVTDIFENSLRNAGAVITAIALIAAIERAFVAVVADLERTGLDPGRLMSRAAGAFRVKASGERLAFRQRFIDAFAEVTNALSPCTPLIVIDDLDRCRPEQVVETLEAVNFLVNAAPCYVVMGFAPEQVMGCVELRYKDIAQQLSMPRSVYARQYLKKLVNIEIAVPKLTDADAENLVRPARPEDDLNRQTDKKTLNDKILMSGVTALRYFNKISWVEVPRRLAKILMVCTVAISLGAVGTSSVAQQWLQNFMASGASESAPGASESAPGASESAPGASESAPGASESAPGASESAPEGSPGTPEEDRSRFRPGDDTEVFWWGYLPFGLVVVFIALQAVMLHSRRLDHTQDSEDFSEALITWLPVVRAWVNSPRQVKRFVNRVRYLAMALSPEPETRMEGFEKWLRGWVQRRSETPLEDFARWLRDWIQGRSETLRRALSGESRKGSKTVSVDGSDDKSRETSTQDLSEPLIIALAALQSLNSHVAMTDDGIPLPPGLLHVFSHQQGDTEQESEFEKWKKALAQKAPAGKNVLGELDKAISEHLEKFKDELDEGKKKRFLDVADGIVLN